MELKSVGEQLMEQILGIREDIIVLEDRIELDKKSLNCQECTAEFYKDHINSIEACERHIQTKVETIRSLERTYRKLNKEHKLDVNKV